MPRQVRIIRNRVPFRGAIFRLVRLLEVIMRVRTRNMAREARDYAIEARVEKVRKDTELAEMRRRKVSNDLVLQDLKIESEKMKLGYPVNRDPALRRPGSGDGAADWD